jgi:hypothetical protein
MPPPAPALSDTREPRCPACRSQRIAPAGRALATDATIESKHLCQAGGTACWLVRRAP